MTGGDKMHVAVRREIMEIIRLDNAERYCRALTYNGILYLSGITSDLTHIDVSDQTKSILEKIDRHLEAAGIDKSRILTALIWLRDIADTDKMNKVWDDWIDPRCMPVRATSEGRLTGDAYRVEIMVTAALRQE